MKEQIKILVELQRIETEKAALASSLSAVPGKTSALDAELKRSETHLGIKQTAFMEQKKNYREQELQVQDILARIRKSQSKMTLVKNNKEYQAFLKEIDELKAKNSLLEDDMLEFLENMDQIEADIVAEKAAYEELAGQIEAEKTFILEKADDKARQLDQLKTEWQQTAARLSHALLTQFNHVKAAHPDGLAVASVTDSVCSGCHLNIPPQMYNELQKGDSIRLCPTCERIIYWREA